MYKNNYTRLDGSHYSSDDLEHYPMVHYKSSHALRDSLISGFLSSHKPSPAGPLNIIGGLSAAMLCESELRGIPAVCLKVIVDSHYVTRETLIGMEKIATELLQVNDIPFDKIQTMIGFKTALKEANTRQHNIFN